MAQDGVRDALFAVGMDTGLPQVIPQRPAGLVLGVKVDSELAAGMRPAGVDVTEYADLAGLIAAVLGGAPVPDAVLAWALVGRRRVGRVSKAGGEARQAERAVGRVLGVIQEFLAVGVLADARLLVMTRGAAAVLPGEDVADLAGAAVAGLVRSAQSENPGRLVLAHLPADAAAAAGAARDRTDLAGAVGGCRCGCGWRGPAGAGGGGAGVG